MPLYEYACSKCDSQFELLIRGDEKPQCPTCGTTRIAKQFSTVAAHSGGGELPVSAPPMGGGCGLPQCGGGVCGME